MPHTRRFFADTIDAAARCRRICAPDADVAAYAIFAAATRRALYMFDHACCCRLIAC